MIGKITAMRTNEFTTGSIPLITEMTIDTEIANDRNNHLKYIDIDSGQQRNASYNHIATLIEVVYTCKVYSLYSEYALYN